MAIAQEKKFKREYNRDRKNDPNFNMGPSLEESLKNVQASQGTPEKSIKKMSGSSLQESLNEVEASQKNNLSSENSADSYTKGQNQSTMARQLNSDKLQDRNTSSDQNQLGKKQGLDNSAQKQDESEKGRWQRIKNAKQRTKNKLDRIKSKANSGEVGVAQAEKLANEAVKRAWSIGHVVVEEALLNVFYLLFLLWPLYLLLCFGRIILAMVGMLTINIKGVKVKLVPGFTILEALTRAGANSLLALISVIEWFVIILLIWVLFNPFGKLWKATWGGLWAVVKRLI